MHLVHVRVLLSDDSLSPEELTALFRSHALPDEQVGHVSIHPDEKGQLTAGFFVTADSVTAAEDTARTVAERAVAGEPALHRARITGCRAVLVPEFYDRLYDVPGRGGRSMRMPDQDTGES